MSSVTVFPHLSVAGLVSCGTVWVYSMLFDVILAFREGRPIPRYQIAMRGHVRGSLLIQQEWWEERQRYTLTATFDVERGSGDKVPPLRDAVLQTADSEYLTISGVEFITAEGGLQPQLFAQAWLLCSAVKRDMNELRRQLDEAKRLHLLAAEKAGFGPRRAGG